MFALLVGLLLLYACVTQSSTILPVALGVLGLLSALFLSVWSSIGLPLMVWLVWRGVTDDITSSVAAGVKQGLASHLSATHPQRVTPPAPPLPRIDYASQEDYVAYRKAHGLPYTPSMWSDGS